MSNDITELAQRMKAAALKAKSEANEWGYDTDAFHDEATPDAVIALVEALEKAQHKIVQVTAERDALREGEMGSAKHSNTRAAADIYFQLVEECDIPAGGSLVEFVDGLKERVCEMESRTVTVKLPKLYSILYRSDFNEPYASNWVYSAAELIPVLAAAGIQVIEGEGQ